MWKNLTLEFKEKECNLSLLDGQEGGGPAVWRWPQSSVQRFGAKSNFLPYRKKKNQKTRLSFAWAPVKEISRALRRKAGKSTSTSRRKTSQSLSCLISCVEFCREIPSRSGDGLHVTRRRFSQTAWWKFPLPSAAGWQPRCTSIQLCGNTERVAVYSLFIGSHSKQGLESFFAAMFSNCTINLNGPTRRLSERQIWNDPDPMQPLTWCWSLRAETERRRVLPGYTAQIQPSRWRERLPVQTCLPEDWGKEPEMSTFRLVLLIFCFFWVFLAFSTEKNLLLSNKERVEELGGDSVSVNGARGHATQACRQKISRIWGFALEIWKSTCTFVCRQITQSCTPQAIKFLSRK